MLAYVVESWERGSTENVILIPVSIAYDQIQDVGSYASEQSGGAKERESFTWFLNTVRSLRLRYGSVHLRFGAPISLNTFFTENPVLEREDEERNPFIPKLAFEVSTRLNEVTPITPISLVTLALLSAGTRALTIDEVTERLEPFLRFVEDRNLPFTEELHAGDRDRLRKALDDLTVHGVVARFDGATDTVYRVGPEQHLAAAYYRNTIIHFFINSAITELALLHVAETSPADPLASLLHEAIQIRDALKFEFFFSGREEFEDEIRAELRHRDVDYRATLAAGGARALLSRFRPFLAPAILRPFLEAYLVVGDVIERHAYESTLDRKALGDEALALGKQYLLQGKLRSTESVSSVLFDSALSLADNRGVFDATADMVERRLGFAAELRALTERVALLDVITAAADAGVLD
jgi:glycerol-3-phosphate O-acyltransferase